MPARTSVAPLLLLVSLAVLASSCRCGAGSERPSGEPLTLDFRPHPLQLTIAYDGSKRFQMWLDTLELARRTQRETGRSVHFTYFITTAYYDPAVQGFAVDPLDVPTTREEALVRWALTQQALNEGHEIANHSVRHASGQTWSEDAWRAEFDEFEQLLEANLFEPVRDAAGKAVFPKWEPLKTAAQGEVGAGCRSAADCHSGRCLSLTPEVGVCTSECNAHAACPEGTVCGSPRWERVTDVCLPMPAFPVEHEGRQLFDAEGRPQVQNLRPYNVVGFRAPFLHLNFALYRVLAQRGYVYDTSTMQPLGPPRRMTGAVGTGLLQFPLMWHDDSLTYAIDDAYQGKDGTGERMEADSRAAILLSYEKQGRVPWNVAQHFGLLRGGIYWQALQRTLAFAAAGCPDDQGQRQCQDVEFPSFRELAERIQHWEKAAGTATVSPSP
ncbi:polysaccharide deacetylase family protein [Pyxidicoccus sp. MSG2]|uniref:polysaccharide deacetylase family protein n=1 Tax=Pyxidicoccus sp. MSG2 TaxID=2996790 RepID=UPI00226FF59B|nr:polysaccharide deacetylase family protein [Pyxidicoccus sp. MSG2]MCY1022576.1 polysaccharide deacetylase family protein [Pyxidicoccus sp. MSG2]